MASKTAQPLPRDKAALRLPLEKMTKPRAVGDNPAVSAARTAPSLGHVQPHQSATPECPYCQSTRHVHRFGWWAEYENVVWFCSNLRTRRDVATVCAYAWREARTLAKCQACRARVTIQRHGDTLGYWCSQCRTFDKE